MEIKIVPLTDLNEKYLFRKDFDAALLYFFSGLHPDQSYRFWHSSQVESGFNVFSYKNQNVDKYLELGRRAFDQEEAKKHYFRFQEEMFGDPPGIFLFWKENRHSVHKRFRGVTISVGGIFSNIPKWWVPKKEQKYREPPK